MTVEQFQQHSDNRVIAAKKLQESMCRFGTSGHMANLVHRAAQRQHATKLPCLECGGVTGKVRRVAKLNNAALCAKCEERLTGR